MSLPEGIHRLSLPIPGNVMGSVNAYAVEDVRGCALIDCGWDNAETLAAMERQLSECGLRLDSVHTIIVSHGHVDHAGLASKLVEQHHPRLMIHRLDRVHATAAPSTGSAPAPGTLEWLEMNGFPIQELTDAERRVLAMARQHGTPAPGLELEGGEEVRIGDFAFWVVWTPGHTTGHICLHDRARGLLIAGDHVLGDVTPIVSYSQGFDSNPMGRMQESLRRVAALDVALVLPGHGEPFSGLRERASKLLEHHAWRERLVVDALARTGPSTAAGIAAQLPWSGKRTPFRDLGIVRRRVALGQAIAHLEKLCAEDRATRELADGRALYRLLAR